MDEKENGFLVDDPRILWAQVSKISSVDRVVKMKLSLVAHLRFRWPSRTEWHEFLVKKTSHRSLPIYRFQQNNKVCLYAFVTDLFIFEVHAVPTPGTVALPLQWSSRWHNVGINLHSRPIRTQEAAPSSSVGRKKTENVSAYIKKFFLTLITSNIRKQWMEVGFLNNK